MTPANLVTTLRNNLADDRMYGIQLFIERLLKRTKFGEGIEQYRITNTATNTKITSITEFANAIAEASLSASFPYNGEGMAADRVVGFEVLLTNLEVQFQPQASEDAFFSKMYDFKNGQKYRFMFHLGYMNDGDDAMPLKVYYIRLYRV